MGQHQVDDGLGYLSACSCPKPPAPQDTHTLTETCCGGILGLLRQQIVATYQRSFIARPHKKARCTKPAAGRCVGASLEVSHSFCFAGTLPTRVRKHLSLMSRHVKTTGRAVVRQQYSTPDVEASWNSFRCRAPSLLQRARR